MPENRASAKEDGRCPGRRKALAFSIFQIWAPLGCVFDVNAATPPGRLSQFYQRTQTRRWAHALLGTPVGRGRGTGHSRKHPCEAVDAVLFQARSSVSVSTSAQRPGHSTAQATMF